MRWEPLSSPSGGRGLRPLTLDATECLRRRRSIRRLAEEHRSELVRLPNDLLAPALQLAKGDEDVGVGARRPLEQALRFRGDVAAELARLASELAELGLQLADVSLELRLPLDGVLVSHHCVREPQPGACGGALEPVEPVVVRGALCVVLGGGELFPPSVECCRGSIHRRLPCGRFARICLQLRPNQLGALADRRDRCFSVLSGGRRLRKRGITVAQHPQLRERALVHDLQSVNSEAPSDAVRSLGAVALRVRFAPAEIGAFCVYLLLQVYAVVGIPPGRWPDSVSYDHLSLTGADSRLPTVPLVYKIFPEDWLRVAVQVVLAAIAWWVLAAVASRLLRDRRARAGLRAVLLLIGLAEPVLNWNSVILSESIALSLTALLVAAAISFAGERTVRSTVLLLVALLFWMFTRQPHVLMVVLIAVVLVVTALRASANRRLAALAAAGAVLIALAGLAEEHRNQTLSRASIGSIIQGRMLPNEQRTFWFVGQGMPYSLKIQSYAGKPFHREGEDPTYLRWIDEHGTATYLKYVFLHPGYTLVDPVAYFPGEQQSYRFRNASSFASLEPNPIPAMLSPVVDYGRHRNVLPSVVDKLLFDQGSAADVLVLFCFAVALALYARRRFGPDPRLAVPILVALAAVPLGYIVWLSGGESLGELDRLSMVTAVSARIGLWIVLFTAADRLLYDRR